MWYPNTPGENFVKFWFIEKLWVSGFDGLELDGHLFTVGDVDPQVDVAETATTDFTDLKK